MHTSTWLRKGRSFDSPRVERVLIAPNGSMGLPSMAIAISFSASNPAEDQRRRKRPPARREPPARVAMASTFELYCRTYGDPIGFPPVSIFLPWRIPFRSVQNPLQALHHPTKGDVRSYIAEECPSVRRDLLCFLGKGWMSSSTSPVDPPP